MARSSSSSSKSTASSTTSGSRPAWVPAAAAAAAALALAAAARRLFWRKSAAQRRLDRQGRAVILKNRAGVEVHITPVGASIQRLLVPFGGSGRKRDVVLGFKRPSSYALLPTPPYFGALVGRCANRIANGRFTIKDQEFKLATNNGPNALHGGPGGFHTRVFSVAARDVTPEGSSVTLTYTSADGEEGYPGTLTVTVKYELKSSSAELHTTITATTDKETPVNLAQHSYFNLAGHGSGTILDHVVQLVAPHYTPVDDVQIPTGEVLPVAGTPFDFSQPTPIGERIEQVPGGQGYDHNYVLFGIGPNARQLTKRNQSVSATPRLAATITEPHSGLSMDLLTTTPGMQLYAGGFLGGRLADAKDGASYPRFGGLCLEAQNFPDAVNQPGFPNVLLRPGESYYQRLVHRFYVKPTLANMGGAQC